MPFSYRSFVWVWALGALSACDARHVLGRDLVQQGCGAVSTGKDLAVCSAGFLSNSATPIEPTIDLGVDGALIVSVPNAAAIAAVPIIKLGGGDAALMRIEPASRRVLSVSTLGEQIVDVEVAHGDGVVAVLGRPFGAALLAPDASRLLWSVPIEGQRVSVGSDGTVAVWNAITASVTLINRSGTTLLTIKTRITAASGDVVVDGTNKLIIVTGAASVEGTVQPVLDAFDYEGTLRWQNYAHAPSEVQAKQLTAVSKGVRIALGRDDQLYFLAESNGGNTVFSRDPNTLAEPAPMVSFDAFSTPYNTSQPITFIARFAPRSGELMLGQLALARAPGAAPQKGVATQPKAIAADAAGRVLVSGTHTCCGPLAPTNTVAGRPLKPSTSDLFVLVLAADFRSRPLWTTFGTGGTSTAGGVVFGAGIAAVTGVQATESIASGPLVSSQPVLPPAVVAGFGTYLAFWPAP